MPTDTPTPDRAPGIRKHRRQYVLAVVLPPELAEQLAARWDGTGESPGRQASDAIAAALGVERG